MKNKLKKLNPKGLFPLENVSIGRKIFGAAFIVAISTAIVKMVAFAKEMVQAWQFGTSIEVDAFLVAFLIPSFFVNVVAQSLNQALVPQFIAVKTKYGDFKSQILFRQSLVIALFLFIIATVIIVLGQSIFVPYLSLGFNEEARKVTYQMLYIMLPYVLLSGLAVIFSAVLSAVEKFFYASLIPVITPICTMILFLFPEIYVFMRFHGV
jgi:putative peptidoglycan lipid II flippase